MQFMVASPSDAEPLHDVVRRAIDRWNRMHGLARGIVLMVRTGKADIAPEVARRTQEVSNRRLLPRSDALIAIFWTRIGTPTDRYESGTVEEIARHTAARKRVMIYFADLPINPSRIDLDQFKRLRAYRKKWSDRAWVGTVSTAEDFEATLYRDLEIVMDERPQEQPSPQQTPEPGGRPRSRISSLWRRESSKRPDPPAARSAEDIEALAAHWLARVDAGLSDERRAELERFLNESPRHRAAYLRLSVAWRRFDALRRLAPLDGPIDEDLLAPQRRDTAALHSPLSPEPRVTAPTTQAPPGWIRALRARFSRR